jgi:SNF2 family DNA or RNA helicase
MNQQHNIHDNPLLKRNPFKTPEGYLESLEEKILSLAGIAQNEEAQEVVTSLRRGRWFGVLKPALLLACTFGVIFGMGYGVLRLTDTLNKPSDTEDSYYTTMIEKGLIRSNFVYSIEEDLENEYFDDEESVFDEEEVVTWLATQYSSMELAQLYYDEK